MSVRIAGMRGLTQGTLTVLTAASPLDENTFDAPTTVAPRTSAVNISGGVLEHTFPPYSLTVLRARAADR
jgi:alpha-L-arabinofuranosidase